MTNSNKNINNYFQIECDNLLLSHEGTYYERCLPRFVLKIDSSPSISEVLSFQNTLKIELLKIILSNIINH